VLLSQYDLSVGLFVDRRLEENEQRLKMMLAGKGVRAYRPFIDGDGTYLPHHWYDQITLSTPYAWQHGKGAWAHFRAMQHVVQVAKREGVENLLRVEDDCVFADEFDAVVAAATEQMASLPRWDLLYYGANHTWAGTEELSPNVLRCHGSYTTHCLGIPRHMFDVVAGLRPVHVIDKVIADQLHPSHRCYAVWPNVAVQKPGLSYLSGGHQDYTDYFRSKGVRIS
jgi:hypothetical protein